MMGFDVCLHEDGNWYELTFRGDVTVKMIQAAMEGMEKETPAGQRRDTLVVFETDCDIGFLDIFNVVDFLKIFHVVLRTRVAVVREDRFGFQKLGQNRQFFSNVLFNNGWDVEFFNERERALEWLLDADKRHYLN